MSARTYLLAAGTFAVGTSAYVVSGVLPAVSADLRVTLSAAGQLATAFALSYAIGAPLLATLTGRWERRTLLVAALLTAGVGNAIAAVAPNYPLLIVGRVVAALGAAAYTPAATLFATGMLPPAARGRAVAVVFGGLTVALVIGVPLGSLLGASLGYRGVFALVSAVCLAVAAGVALLLPKMEPSAPVPLRERFAAAADRRVLLVLAVTVVGVLAALTVYTYAAPFLTATGDIHGATIGLVLLAYGLGGVFGNILGGRATDRFGPMRTLIGASIGVAAGAALLPFGATSVVGASLVLFVWAGFGWAFNPPVQALLLELGPEGGLLLSLNASAIYFGAGLSGIVGGLVISVAGVGALPVISVALSLVVIVLALLLRRAVSRREPAPAIPVTAAAGRSD